MQHDCIALAEDLIALLTATGCYADVRRVARSVVTCGEAMAAEAEPQLKARGLALQLGAIACVPDALLVAVRTLEAELRATVNGGV